MTTGNAAANFGLGIQTDSAFAALEELEKRIHGVRSALEQLNARLPTDAMNAQMREQAAATATLQRELEQANQKIVRQAEESASKIRATYRNNLGNGITISMKIDSKTALEAAAGDLEAIYAKADTARKADVAKAARAEEEKAAARVIAERAAQAQVDRIRIEGDLLDRERRNAAAQDHNNRLFARLQEEAILLNKQVDLQRAAEAQRVIAARETEAQLIMMRLEGAAREREIAQKAAQDHNNALYARLQAEAQFENRVRDLRAKRAADDKKRMEDEIERQRVLNASFAASSPTSRLSTARLATEYAARGGDAAARYGSEAAALANANGLRRLTEEVERNSTSTRRNSAMVTENSAALRSNAAALHEAHSAARGLSGGLGMLWMTYGSILPLLGGFALATGVKEAIAGFAAVEYQMTFVKELAEDTTLTVKELAHQMHEVSVQLGISPQEASKGLRILAQAGLDAHQAILALPDVFKLATVGELDMATAANALIGVMNAYTLPFESITHIGDVMAKAGAMSATSVESMTQSMKIASPVAAQFKVSLEETALALTALAKVNITGTMAGTAVKNMIQEMAAPTSKKNRSIMEMLGFSAYDKSTGELKPLLEQVDQLRRKLEEFDRESQGVILTALFGAKGEKAFFALLKQSREDAQKMLDTLSNADGFVDGVFSKLMLTNQGQFQKLKAQVLNTFAEIGEETQGPINELLIGLRRAFASEELRSALRGLTQSIVSIGSAASTTLGPVLAVWAVLKTSNMITLAVMGIAGAMLRMQVAITEASSAMAAFNVIANGNVFVKLISLLLTAAGLYMLLRETKRDLIEQADDEIRSVKEATEEMRKENEQRAKKILLMQQGRNEQAAELELKARDAETAATKISKELADLRNSPEYKRQAEGAVGTNLGAMNPMGDVSGALNMQGDHLLKRAQALEAREAEATQVAGEYRKVVEEKQAQLEELRKIREAEEKKNAEELNKVLKTGTKTFSLDDLKGGDKAANDRYHAAQAALDGQLQELRDRQRLLDAASKSANRRGELGDLQLINAERDHAIASLSEELRIYEQKETLAAKQENRRRDEQGILNKQAATERAILAEVQQAADRREELLADTDNKILEHERQTMRDRGQLQAAFLYDFAAQYGVTIAKIQADLADPSIGEALKTSLTARLQELLTMQREGVNKAAFTELKNQFDEQFRTMQEKLAEVRELGDGEGNMSAALGVAQLSDDIRSQALPALEALRQQMLAVAEASGNSKLKAEVAKLGKDLSNVAHDQIKLWQNLGKSISQSLGDAFGQGGKAIGNMIDSLIKYGTTQEKIDERLRKNTDGKDPNSPEYIRAVDEARKSSFDLQIQSYGDLAGAMKGYFDEHSAGYATLQAIERAFRLFQLAMTIQDMVTKLTATETITTAMVAADQVKAASAETSAASVIAAAMAEANASATAGVAAQAQGDPYSAFARMAAMAAIMAGLGLAVRGIRGGEADYANNIAERQKKQDTGTVLGEADAKSESIANSLKYIEQNSNIALQHSQGMLAALRSIDDGIEGLGRFVAQAGGISGNPNFSFSGQSFGSWKNGFLGLNTFTRELLDAGLLSTGGKRTLGSMELNPYYSFDRFQQVRETDSGFLGISFLGGGSETKVTTAPMSDAFNRQVGLIMRDIGRSAIETGKALGISEATMRGRVNSETFWLGDLSTKGMNSTDVEKALQAKFSDMSDRIFKDILPGYERFQKAGEGYSETVMRVATAAESARFKLDQLGVSMVGLDKLSKVTGDTQTELVRESILRKESTILGTQRIDILGARIPVLVTRLTNLGEIIRDMGGSADDLITTYQQLLDVQERMRQTGQAAGNLSRDTIYGAGGLDRLQAGLRDYQQRFFTDAEQAQFKLDHLRTEFAKAGLSLPNSMESFKQYATWLASQPGEQAQKMYGKLIALSGEFADAFDSDTGALQKKREDAYQRQVDRVNELASSVNRFHDASKSAQDILRTIDKETGGPFADISRRIFDLTYGLKNQIGSMTVEQQLEYEKELQGLIGDRYNTEKENAEKLIDLGRQLREYVQDLRLGDLSPLTPAQKLAQAQGEYLDTLAKAQAGDQDALGKVQDKASAYLGFARDYYASSGQYTSIFDAVHGALQTLSVATTNSGETSLAQAQAKRDKALDDLRDAAQHTYVIAEQAWIGQKALLEAALVEERNQAIALGKISVVPDILAGLPADIARQMASLYPNLEYVRDDSSKSNYPSQKPWASMTAAERNAVIAQAVGINGSHAGGLDYVPFDGYIAQLHRGERVLTALQASSRDEALVAELRALREEVAQLRAEQNEQTAAMLRAQYEATDRAADKTVEGHKEVAEGSDWQRRAAPHVV